MHINKNPNTQTDWSQVNIGKHLFENVVDVSRKNNKIRVSVDLVS